MDQRLNIDNLQISYTHTKNVRDQNLAVIFLHGWRGTKESWNPNITTLSKYFDCIALDMPGFGKSESPKNPWGVKEYSEFLNKFIKYLSLNRVILVGKSFGGRIAIHYACNHPQTMEKLVLVSSAGVEGKSIKTKVTIFLTKILKGLCIKNNAMRKELLSNIYYKILKINKEETSYKQEAKKLITSMDLTEHCRRIKVPTLVIWGKDDKVLPLKIGIKLHKLIEGSRFVVINGGHNAHIDSYNEFNAHLHNFIKDCP